MTKVREVIVSWYVLNSTGCASIQDEICRSPTILEHLNFRTKPLQTSPYQGRLKGLPPDKGGLRGVGFKCFRLAEQHIFHLVSKHNRCYSGRTMKQLLLSLLSRIISLPFRLLRPLRYYWGRIWNGGRAAAQIRGLDASVQFDGSVTVLGTGKSEPRPVSAT